MKRDRRVLNWSYACLCMIDRNGRGAVSCIVVGMRWTTVTGEHKKMSLEAASALPSDSWNLVYPFSHLDDNVYALGFPIVEGEYYDALFHSSPLPAAILRHHFEPPILRRRRSRTSSSSASSSSSSSCSSLSSLIPSSD